jgi:hypothetical protein
MSVTARASDPANICTSTCSVKEALVPRKEKAWQRALLAAIPSTGPTCSSDWHDDLSDSDDECASSISSECSSDWYDDLSESDDECAASVSSLCSADGDLSASDDESTSQTTSDVAVQADLDREHSPAVTTWEDLLDEVARTQVRPRKLIRMRAKQLAEDLLMVWHGSSQDKEGAVRRFVLATTGEETLRSYSCVVLRGLLQAKGYLASEICGCFA